MGKTKRHMKNMKAQTHKKKAHTHKKKHTGRKHRRNHTRKMSGGIFSIKRRLRDRRVRREEKAREKAIEEDEKRRIQLNIKQPAAVKESKNVGYFPEFPPRARLHPGIYDDLNKLNRLKHEYAQAVPPSNASYASVGSASKASYANARKSSGSYASVGPASKAIYAIVKGDSATPYENKPNPNDIYAVINKDRRVILGADGNKYQEEKF